MRVGTEVFVDRHCRYTNCFVTSNRKLLGDYTKFDVIAFAGPQTVVLSKAWLPKRRSPHQKYVFASIESPGYYPVCSNKFDGYFNWTWTYRLDSDARWGYLIIKDEKGNIIGPKKDMHWIDKKDMRPVTPELKKILSGKTKAAAWFVSNCITKSKRELIALELQRELSSKYHFYIDAYGHCGTLKCSRANEKLCDEKIKKDYYFYLSFENSFGEDYVTEKLLHAVRYSAIPIVYGGANYSRFLPEGSYLNARELGVQKLAKRMIDLIFDFEEYSSYFKWTNHYSYHARAESADTDDYCGICALLNDEKKLKETTTYHEFEKWWGLNPERCEEMNRKVRN
ncbi:alpha-(1,3)-fucosyltransferase C-like [Pectinophora gossypiella]|uniref:alpha-(1,3)-fucosyltransferase C-like n=1 Tax=Pectinophora gossypiella TaxID=13191 RepID=UPI00214EF7DC|nr:alpha-(1,3)-fucosyltransferase C-like [Pectinophora gossypiella]